MSNLTQEMQVVPSTQGSPHYFAFESSVSLSAAGDSNAILVPKLMQGITVTLSVSGGGQGKVQTTTDLLYDVKEGTVVWVDWSSGIVSANTQASFYPVTAIRLVQSSVGGATKLTVRAQ